MKAKFFEFNGQSEIVLENGNVIASNEGEAKVDFLNRASEEVNAEFVEDLEVTEVTASSLKKKANKALVAAFDKATGVEAELIKSVLESRGVVVGESTEEATAEGEATEETAEAPKKEKKAKKEKVEKAPREKREKPSLSETLDQANAAKVNIGKVVEFVPFRCAFKVLAEIKRVVTDTRVNRAYFRMTGIEDGKLYHAEITNSTITIDEEATEKLAAERAAEAEAKEAKKAEEKAAKKAKAKAKAETEEAAEEKPKKKGGKKAKAETTEEVAETPSNVYIAPEVSGDDEEAIAEAE